MVVAAESFELTLKRGLASKTRRKEYILGLGLLPRHVERAFLWQYQIEAKY